MSHTLLVAGTASHVGKSTVAAGLCRALADAGVSVAPFKAQNMSNNARAVPTSAGAGAASAGTADDAGVDAGDVDAGDADAGDAGGTAANDGDANDGASGAGPAGPFGEVGVSQYVQARAARVPPETDHNPVLLKPRGDGESQLVIDGEAVGHYAAGSYYGDRWERARAAAEAAHARLADRHDVVVAEGAGSIAEINLHDRDLANVETARFADADVLLVADIERGGVFASLVGTLELLPADLRDRVVGAAITKFRGDRSILEPGLAAFEERTGVPVLGVLPYDDPGLPEEDSVALPGPGERAVRGGDGVPDGRSVTVAVPRLPRASNVTDLEPLAREPGVRVAYLPVEGADAGDAAALAAADALVLSGTKNTADDLLALRASPLWIELKRFEGPVVGLCGGYQILGERVTGAAIEGTGDRDAVDGLGLLPVGTTFSAEKRVAAATLALDGAGPLDGADGPVEGYEIHAGETRALDPDALAFPFSRTGEGGGRNALPSAERGGAALGAARGDVLGTYLHDLFANRSARGAFVAAAYRAAGRERPAAARARVDAGSSADSGTGGGDGADRGSPYDRAAALVCDHVEIGALLPEASLPVASRSGGRSEYRESE